MKLTPGRAKSRSSTGDSQRGARDRTSEERARFVIDASLDAFVAMDHEGRIVEWNRQAGVTFGWSRAEAMGRMLADTIIPPQHREGHRLGLARFLATGDGPILSRRIEVSAIHRSGREFPAEIEITPILTGDQPVFGGFIRDITDRVEMERDLLERESWLHRAQLMARMAHVATRSDGSFEGWSQTITELIGRPTSEVPRTTREWMLLIHPEDRSRFRDAAIEAARTGRRKDVEYRLQCNGGWVHLRQWMEPIDEGPDPRPRRWVSTIQDVSEQKRAEDEIRALNATLERRVAERTAELEGANKELEAFDYSISHDLQGPIQRIRGFCAALLEDRGTRLDATVLDYVQRIARTGDRMDELVRDILRLSVPTRHELQRTEVDMSLVAAACFEALRRSQPDRPVLFRCVSGMTAHADFGMMRAALENLLGNAWKFTAGCEHACIEFACSIEGEGKVFHVSDNGVGFDPKHADELFKPFRRMHDPRQFEGTGIGLTTVQRIIRRHGGRIWAEGNVGRGAAFHFTVSPA